ncbi:ATP-dependent Clp protease adapter ClpS [Pararhizobium sp. BT-229]|uniref:ATP-dependent Clp protease adapter ClpS n=1 Tax=Pararhizobium sp. BT-229 TaxID=2986923 RepID=UPI0021F7936E|nr:ATP-dependent Clp protease adapter ClpS [Pararhizobium sp. BT-229]MCV9964529.1 ATP-dependent Clp protease adapter ClpS [Pararhizobium sp. BT-229]
MPTNDLDLLEKQDVKLERPKMYQVVMYNDDFTPFDFVVVVLMQFFNKGLDEATAVMMQVHTQGKGICGVFPKDIAETKATEVMKWAKVEQHPLRLEVEAQA